MTAVGDTLTFVRALIKGDFPICMEGRITSQQMGEVVVKYIRDNPRDLNAASVQGRLALRREVIATGNRFPSHA
jgi:hypothetical protein